MNEEMSIEQRRSRVARMQADGLGVREIARALGVNHSQVSRDLAYLGRNGAEPDHGATAAAVAIAEAADEQPVEEVALHQVAEASPIEHVMRAVVELGGGATWTTVRDLLMATRMDRAQAELALSQAQRFDAVRRAGGGLELTDRGEWMLEQKAAQVVKKRAPSRFADLRAAYIASLPTLRRELRAQVLVRQARRLERQQEEERALSRYIPAGVLWDGWRIGAERAPGTDNVLALYPPRFDDLGRSDVYVQLVIDRQQDVLWVAASTGGPRSYLRPSSAFEQVRAVIAQVYVPAVDPTAEPLPTLDNLEDHRS